MTVTSVHKDPVTRTMTLTADYAAAPERVWLLWADPRRLERWWGPPDNPATVVDHDLTPGGKVTYYVSGPEGERHSGWWDVRVVDEPRSLEFEMGDPAIPSLLVRVRIAGRDDGGTRMVIVTTFPSDEAMDQLIVMGYEQGLSAAVSQIDEVLRA